MTQSYRGLLPKGTASQLPSKKESRNFDVKQLRLHCRTTFKKEKKKQVLAIFNLFCFDHTDHRNHNHTCEHNMSEDPGVHLGLFMYMYLHDYHFPKAISY
jgi:hypothetical protein